MHKTINIRPTSISSAQAEELQRLMARGRIREGTVIKTMAPGLRSITQLPAADFDRVRTALRLRLQGPPEGATVARQQVAVTIFVMRKK